MPAVTEEQRLVCLDMAPDKVPQLLRVSVEFTWLDSLGWDSVSNYAKALALDASVPHRGFAITDVHTADALPSIPELRMYAPLCLQRVPH